MVPIGAAVGGEHPCVRRVEATTDRPCPSTSRMHTTTAAVSELSLSGRWSGKSTLSAVMARQMARGGWRVVAVDADEQRNLAATLGLGPAESMSIVPVSENAAYVREKTGARPGRAPEGFSCSTPTRPI